MGWPAPRGPRAPAARGLPRAWIKFSLAGRGKLQVVTRIKVVVQSMLPNYDTQGIGMYHIYFVCPITEPCVTPRANRKGYTSIYMTDWYMPVGYECIRPGAVSRWHNDDPVWSIQCNNRVPSVANAGLMIHDCVGNYMWFCITPYLYGVTGARLVVMGKRGLASSAADVTCSGKAIWLVTGVQAGQMRSPRVSLGE